MNKKAALFGFALLVPLFLVGSSHNSNGLRTTELDNQAYSDDCFWRPGEPILCKVEKSTEWRPVYMEDMIICSSLLHKEMEKSKWSWGYPEETDLYIFAEFIGGSTRDITKRVLIANRYIEIKPNHPEMAKKEKLIRWMFANINKNYEFVAIKQHAELDKQWESSLLN